ncbi:TBC1 domain family member 13 [Morus notabilis]|uniref:TBC1 domain family member 13 n=1 Tax=Morus notabilis TaxID=981085 RepID=W9QKC2_9ROSA|nr:TBC1 domain family member 13 [Morus notabilis]
MPRGKTKLPDRLGSLVAGPKEREEGFLGEELETFQPNGFGSDRESENDAVEGFDESGFRVRRRPERNSAGSVSALEAIAADAKRCDFEYELSQPEINLEKLQRVASTGLPNGGSLRATTWKLLLGYLPPSRELWEKELTKNRTKYAKLKEELLLSPSEVKRRKDGDLSPNDRTAEIDVAGLLKRHEISREDHPLSLGKSSAWNQYSQHTEITEQIDRDLQRTHPDMKFFLGDSSSSKKNRVAMRNILLLFSKLNPAIRYVQGMNEVLAPMFYVFSTDPNVQNAENAEADSFSCFVRLLSDSVDHFCQQLDNSSVGILSTLSRLMELLRANDEELWRHLEFTTKDMLLRVCCAMLLCIKSSLLSGDFVANLKLLQHYPDINIERLLQVAQDLSPDTSSYRLSP